MHVGHAQRGVAVASRRDDCGNHHEGVQHRTHCARNDALAYRGALQQRRSQQQRVQRGGDDDGDGVQRLSDDATNAARLEGEAELQRVWEAADANVDGVLQSDEFACALALAEKKRVVRSLPSGGRAAHSAQLR